MLECRHRLPSDVRNGGFSLFDIWRAHLAGPLQYRDHLGTSSDSFVRDREVASAIHFLRKSSTNMAPRGEPTNVMDHMDSEEVVLASVSSPSKVEGVSVGFADLTYEVPLKGKGKKNDGVEKEPDNKLTILHSISGSFLPGKMIALMGPR